MLFPCQLTMKQVQCISKDCQVCLLFSSRTMDQIHLINVSMTKKTFCSGKTFLCTVCKKICEHERHGFFVCFFLQGLQRERNQGHLSLSVVRTFFFQTDKMHIYEYVVEYVMHASTNTVHTPLMFTSFSMHLHL